MEILSEVLAKKYEKAPQLSYMWRVELPVLGQYVDPTGALNSYVSQFVTPQNDVLQRTISGISSAEEMCHRVYEFNAPYKEYEVERRTFGSTFTFAASHNETGNITLLIDEYEDGKTFEYITTWMDYISNPDLSKNPPGFYKRNIRFLKMTSMQTDIHFTDYVGCFPINIAPINNTYESNAVMQYNVTFSCDKAVYQVVSPTGKEGREKELLGKSFKSK